MPQSIISYSVIASHDFTFTTYLCLFIIFNRTRGRICKASIKVWRREKIWQNSSENLFVLFESMWHSNSLRALSCGKLWEPLPVLRNLFWLATPLSIKWIFVTPSKIWNLMATLYLWKIKSSWTFTFPVIVKHLKFSSYFSLRVHGIWWSTVNLLYHLSNYFRIKLYVKDVQCGEFFFPERVLWTVFMIHSDIKLL